MAGASPLAIFLIRFLFTEGDYEVLSLVRFVGDPIYLVIPLVWLGEVILVRLWWLGWCVSVWAHQKGLSEGKRRFLGVGNVLLPAGFLAIAGVWLLRQDPLIIERAIAAGILAAGLVWIGLAVQSFIKKRPLWQRVRTVAVWIVPLFVIIGCCGYFAQQAEAFAEFRQPGETVITGLDQRGQPMINEGRPVKIIDMPRDPGDYLVIRKDARMFIVHLPVRYKVNGQHQAGMMYLTGSDESAPWEAPFSHTRLSQRALPPDGLPDRISVYPISKCQYRFFGERRYAWNSSLGSLSPYSGRDDDAIFVFEVRQWMIDNLDLDEELLTLVGFSDGGVTAGGIVGAGLFPVYRFVSLGGAAISFNPRSSPKAKGLKEVVIQLNDKDDTTLPNDKDGNVVQGDQ